MEMVVIIAFANVAFTDPFRYTQCITHLATTLEQMSRHTTFVSLVSIMFMEAGRVDMIIINDEEIN